MSALLVRVLSVMSGVIVVAFFLVRVILIANYDMPPPRNPPHRVTNVPAFQLFPPNAAISLTEDNSTFFPARPAAFGAELPDDGLSAALWIGAGFGEDGVEPQGELGCSDVPGWNGKLASDGAPVLPVEGFLDDGTDNYLEEYFLGTSSLNVHKVVHARADAVNAKRDGDHKSTETAAAVDVAAAAASAFVPVATGLVSEVQASKEASRKDASRVETTGHTVPHHSDIESLQEGAEIAGKIVLLRRGGCGFLAKVMWAQRRGAVAVIVGDDRKGGPLIQMYAAGDTSFVTIPSVFTAHTTAHLLTALVAAAVQDETAANKKAAVKQAKTKTQAPVPGNTETSDEWFWKTRPREWVLDEYVPTATAAGALPTSTANKASGTGHALYVTIAPTRGTLPLIDMLLVVIASPLLAVIVITGVLLFIRTQYRYRAWRAPKAVVEQLPVHIYAPPGTAPTTITIPIGSAVASPLPSPPRSPSPPTLEPTLTTPLLQRPRSRTTTGVPGDERRTTITVPAPPPHRPRYFQSECVVCLEDYVAGDRVMSLPCGHEFHAACITPWLTTRRRTCPICKSDVVKAAAAGESA
ncbi:ring-9 protein [Ophiostoma piceae UAMH 11346]|uniref:RING-type E3 ubiquitin transferase n=1 Tax=Ophiostoma piceae (strain UAMH 11346) TaxID=1262450 RepID=S3CDY4_OPHP1|nr:ring-9 protein [Ophiostoma piceae UAMH 11346]